MGRKNAASDPSTNETMKQEIEGETLSDPPKKVKPRVMFYRSYHSEELVPVIVVVCAVAMTGHLKAASILALLGFGYWFYIVAKDRLRQLVTEEGGVCPDGTNFTYKDGQLKGIVELVTIWLDLEPHPLPLPARVKCTVFPKEVQHKGSAEGERKLTEGEEVEEEEEEDVETTERSDWFPKATTMELLQRSTQQEAVEKGVKVLCILILEKMKGGKEAEMVAQKAVATGVVTVCMRACLMFPQSEAAVAPSLQLLCHLAHHLSGSPPRLRALAETLPLQKLVSLLSTGVCMRSSLVVRRGLQLLGGLADNNQNQKELLQLQTVQLVVTAMRRHKGAAEVAQWGSWTLFNLSYESKSLLAINMASPGFIKAVSQAVTFAMKRHPEHQETQRCGSMAFVALLMLPMTPEEQVDLLKDGTIALVVKAAHEQFSENAEIETIWGKVKFMKEKLGLDKK